jgi:G8 domain
MKSFLRLILLVPLSLVSAVNDFVPLSCNGNLASAVCNSWTSIFGSSSTFTSQIIIPCGTCVQMNHPGPALSLLGGINIIGKLIFPNDGSYTLTINTASIIVQGELDMQSTLTPVTGTPLLRIVMIGLDEKLSFRPVNENANACPNFDCEVGFKSITVAGGKVNCTCTNYSSVPYQIFFKYKLIPFLFALPH